MRRFAWQLKYEPELSSSMTIQLESWPFNLDFLLLVRPEFWFSRKNRS